jgi:two-component system phosphate regulon sensor histidine kinase PhoR
MAKKHLWIWVVLFILVMLVLGTLATGWNVVLVQHYHQILKTGATAQWPWIALTLGTLGFAGALSGLVLFFIRLLKEMRLNQLQSEFLAAVSHELRTPIATMELSSSLLQAGGISEEESRRLWASHDNELKRLKEEVDTLLEAARLQSSALMPRKSAVLLESWLNDSFVRWGQILGPGARLQREGEPLACQAWLDKRMLSLITDNLLDNARKFSRERPDVVVRSRRLPAERAGKPGRWQIQIQDQGWGFDPADSEKIFKRFVRARTDAPYSIPGTGLGLYIAAAASRAMGIRLRGESAGAGQGAVFTLEGPERPAP